MLLIQCTMLGLAAALLVPAQGGTVLQQLRRVSPGISDERVETLLDSLAAIVIGARPHGEDALSFESGHKALSYILLAGADESHGIPGVPYPGAIDRLMRVRREAADEGFRHSAVRQLPLMAGTAIVIQLLREVLVSDEGSAYAAAVALSELMTDPRVTPERRAGATAALRDVYERAGVRNALARQLLERIAELRGWRREVPSG